MLFNQCTYGAFRCAAIDEAEEWIAGGPGALASARHDGAARSHRRRLRGRRRALDAATSISLGSMLW